MKVSLKRQGEGNMQPRAWKKKNKRFQKMHNELAHGLIPVESVGI